MPIQIGRTYHFELGKPWEIVEYDRWGRAWIRMITTNEFFPCDDTFDGWEIGAKFKLEDVQIIPVPPVGVARLKYLAA